MSHINIYYTESPKGKQDFLLSELKLTYLRENFTKITFDKIVELEKSHNLYTELVQDYPIWFYLRLKFYYYFREILEIEHLYHHLSTKYSSIHLINFPAHIQEPLSAVYPDWKWETKTHDQEQRKIKPHSFSFNKILRLSQDLFYLLKTSIKLALRAHTQHLIFYCTYTEALRIKKKGRLKDVNYKLIDSLKKKHDLIEFEIIDTQKIQKSLRSNRLSNLPFKILTNIQIKCLPNKNLKNQIELFIQNLSINKEETVQQSLNSFLKIEKSTLLRYLLNLKTYGQYLKIIQPDLLLCRNGVFTPFNFAAKELKIPIIDVQHGIIYSFDALNCFPNINQLQNHPFPDHVLLWAENYKKAYSINNYPKENNIHITGNIYAESVLQDLNLETIKTKLNIKPGNRSILIATQKDFAEIYIQIINELLKIPNPKFNFIIKTHPNEMSHNIQKFKQLIQQDVRFNIICDDSFINSFEAISIVDCVITSGSTIALEAQSLEKPVICIDSPFLDILEDWLKDLKVISIKDIHNISHYLNELESNTIHSSKSFSFQAVEKASDTIDSILEGTV